MIESVRRELRFSQLAQNVFLPRKDKKIQLFYNRLGASETKIEGTVGGMLRRCRDDVMMMV